jgi:hypothetical protein
MASNLRNENDPARYYTWQAPGGVLSIHLSLKVIEELTIEHARASAEGMPWDMRGVLLGRSTPLPHRATFVEDFVLISSTTDGSSTSASDDALTEVICKRHRGGDGEPMSIGLFRFQQDGSLIPSERDLKLANRLFSRPENVMLLIRFSRHRGTEAGFFYRQNGRIHDFVHVFPFDKEKLSLGTGKPDTPLVPSFGTSTGAALGSLGSLLGSSAGPSFSNAEPSFSSAGPSAGSPPYAKTAGAAWDRTPIIDFPRSKELDLIPPKTGGIRWWQLLPTAALFTFGTIAAQTVLNSRDARPTIEALLGLKVTSEVHQVQIRWNRDSKFVQEAEYGELKITDAGLMKVMPISRRHLLDGYVTYTPMSSDVRVSLEMMGQNGVEASESVSIVAIP